MTGFATWGRQLGRMGFLALVSASTLARAAPPALEAFFNEAAFTQAKLSPDGQRVAFLASAAGGLPRLVVLEAATLKPTVVAAFKEFAIDEVHWVSDKRLVYSLASELDGPGFTYRGEGLFGIDADGTRPRMLVDTTRTAARLEETGRDPLSSSSFRIANQWPQASGHMVAAEFAGQNDQRHFFNLYKVNTLLASKESIEVPSHTTDWLFDAEGQPRAAWGTSADKLELFIFRSAKGWVKTAQGEYFGGTSLVLPRYAAGDGALYGVGPGPHDRSAVYRLDASTGLPSGPPLLAHPQFDMDTVAFIGNRKGLLGLRFPIDAEITHWLDPAMKALQARIDARLQATTNRMSIPERGDSPFVLIQAYSDVQPTHTYLWDTQTDRLTLLGRAHPKIEAAQMGQTDFYRVPARDGMSIPTYLTLPPGAQKKKLPLVLWVHGGPWVRGAVWGWNAEVQFLASRGYAVLQPEFRGSTGHGHAHFQAGFKQWGRAMQDDLMDALKWAIDQGHADADRVCIMGASYGGYAALMGLARDGERFRCAIAASAVTDLDLMANAHWSDLSAAYKTYGVPLLVGDVRSATMQAVSPVQLAARITKPLLLAHGSLDVRVPPQHGRRLRDALAPHNPQLQWVEYADEGHGLAKAANRLDFYQRVEKFLAQQLATR
jgi:dipeptidyl aminopeptidase/acylaminoacyl peptidase